jgi:hypothetical protein
LIPEVRDGKMEHIHGKVYAADQLVLDDIDGYLGHHDRKGRKSYYGYFEMATDSLRGLSHETCYQLALQDGRRCDIYVEVVPSNAIGRSVAEFHVTGGIRRWV